MSILGEAGLHPRLAGDPIHTGSCTKNLGEGQVMLWIASGRWISARAEGQGVFS